MWVCPDGTTEYSYYDIPSNTYCVSLSEGYQIDIDECPSGYGTLRMVSFDGPDTYKCLPLHNMYYKCDDGYLLNGSYCYKTIPATQN